MINRLYILKNLNNTKVIGCIAILIGIFVNAFGPFYETNFWLNFIDILTNKWFIACVVIATGASTINITQNFDNLNFKMRYSKLEFFIENTKLIILNTSLNLLFSLLIILISTVFLSQGNYTITNYLEYESVLMYIFAFSTHIFLTTIGLNILLLLTTKRNNLAISYILIGLIIVINTLLPAKIFFNDSLFNGFTYSLIYNVVLLIMILKRKKEII